MYWTTHCYYISLEIRWVNFINNKTIVNISQFYICSKGFKLWVINSLQFVKKVLNYIYSM